MDIEHFSIFFITTFLLVLVPGPSALTAAAQGASLQSSKAFIGVLGIASADLIFFGLSATGISALIVASSTLFSVIKWLGVAFLIYLGLSVLLSKASAIQFENKKIDARTGKLFRQGLVIQLANPKALMYFSALLPQFINPNEPLLMQLAVMALTLFLADCLVYSLYGYLGFHMARQKLKAWLIRLINRAAGLTLLFTGIKMAMLENHGS
ncbi:LysE family translocator [Thiosulfativibrio zosterae]|uniref:Flagellar biosynthesis protein FlgM n=1 Tax=Thiosulfativibrio zosterae TaxID=2675053 RepID=A0A6F8PNU8_9GAMM|nr:LysE family translocator [Thiosulfativibrio zosterae]BBP43789.1 flagellar biosynthesis protein FlgM [Thiosulfativibrio zosterae]